ncbi:TM0106 family RecB-like putative nuclease [Leptospirillum ferriphilum]|uniref:TM0106 family RecB-like putative nuclease n=1 Tax=Leptospirillum ferriphilum TaxID=178606 RepID=UPI0006B14FA5|nr:TM0106 family RecB-like putative nuclease [Leptospirillum ferriphilum]
MQFLNGTRIYSATDLIHFLACRHHTFLDIVDLHTPLPKAESDPEAELLQDKGKEHEKAYLQKLKSNGHQILEIPSSGLLLERAEATRNAMISGVEFIYQAALLDTSWHAYIDFLRRIETPSNFGNFSYEVIDTKLSRSPTSNHIIQICAYSDLLAKVQGCFPQLMHLVLGDGREESFRVDDFHFYYRNLKKQFETFSQIPPEGSYPEPCTYCDLCRWKELCAKRWEEDDHLSLVANIRRNQIQHLREAGIPTVRKLAELPENHRIFHISQETLERLRHQAVLQVRKRDTGKNQVEILSKEDGRGFARMPRPDIGDLFFDIEGDPLFPDGLEYLFGVYGVNPAEAWYRSLWGHDHEEERLSFETLLDFFAEHLANHPEAHIYHYNHYEPTALKRLASRYATREVILDDLLRRQKFVDLFTVVRESIRVSESSYSLKNLEVFFREKRADEVTTAGQSIVVYERWRQNRNDQLLEEIEAYNKTDCESTKQLRDWLVTLRPAGMPWRVVDPKDSSASENVLEFERQRQEFEKRLLEEASDEGALLNETVSHLLEFHRREAKPQWWAMFDRQNRDDEELIDDAECLAALEDELSLPPEPEKKSVLYSYRFPPQDYKFSAGDSCRIAGTLEPAGEIFELDPDLCVVRIKRSLKAGPLPKSLSVIPSGPIKTDVLRNAIYRFAESILSGESRYQSVLDLLSRKSPRLKGRKESTPIIDIGSDPVSGAITAVFSLTKSYLFIQGPPGSGKTYTSSHIITEMIRAGKRVGVASNSHKAINHLLRNVETRAKELGLKFRGQKKSTANKPESFLNGNMIEDITDNNDIDPSADLIAGTAWLFARPELDQLLDFLFVDEAGQVSLANIVAMGISAKNIVLIGDQMQLGQPIQGIHPGESGQSVLEFLLREKATIPPDQGIFLPTTWRMHSDVCRFISDAVYEGRLLPEPSNQNQRILLSDNAHPVLSQTGIRFVSVEHSGCSQKNEIEGIMLREIYLSLLEQSFSDRYGQIHRMTPENILVVTPYNVQVNYLKSILPEGTRVGTVDKFQGQEAEGVLISMVTSSGEELPRNIEFLYSRNRLNVAISRARCLALILASPKLLEVRCNSIEQMRLVNTLCRVREYASKGA